VTYSISAANFPAFGWNAFFPEAIYLNRMVRYSLTLLFAVYALADIPDAATIVQRSVDRDTNNFERSLNYTYQERTVEKEFDGNGKITKTETTAHETMMLYGQPYHRMTEKNGAPLAGKEEQKEKDKLDKLMRERANETPAQRDKRIKDFRDQQRKNRELVKEIPKAFQFSLAGESNVGGRDVWVIDASPRADYQPNNVRAKLLTKLKAKMYIGKSDYQFIKAEAEAIDTISFGLVLARLYKGSTFSLEFTHVNEEVWFPKLIQIHLDARLAMLKHIRGTIETNFFGFKKFQSESKIVATGEEK
jgi:hypothetical protein